MWMTLNEVRVSLKYLKGGQKNRKDGKLLNIWATWGAVREWILMIFKFVWTEFYI